MTRIRSPRLQHGHGQTAGRDPTQPAHIGERLDDRQQPPAARFLRQSLHDLKCSDVGLVAGVDNPAKAEPAFVGEAHRAVAQGPALADEAKVSIDKPGVRAPEQR